MHGSGRSRWFGAGLAVALGLGGLVPSDVGASVSSGERSVFVPITPCRLFDTRPAPDTVGPRPAALGAGETFTVVARGVQGNCNLPADATAVAMNVAVIGGTANSFLTVFPAGGTLPLSANLNWVAGQPPTPNKVDIGLSADGRLSFYNFAGTVNVAADVTGYYVDHTHDDRYYRKDEVDSKLGRLATGVLGLGPDAFRPIANGYQFDVLPGKSLTALVTPACVSAPADLPDGATITSVTARFSDTSGASEVIIEVLRDVLASNASDFLTSYASGAAATPGSTAVVLPAIPAAQAVVDRRTYVYLVSVCVGPNQILNGVVINYAMP